jgi:hypothetical protein
LGFRNDICEEIGWIAKITIVQEDFGTSRGAIFVNAASDSVNRRGTTDDSMDLIVKTKTM